MLINHQNLINPVYSMLADKSNGVIILSKEKNLICIPYIIYLQLNNWS